MPTISRFFGIIIRMYFLPKEHIPPHIHVIYDNENFAISISDLNIISGASAPSKRILSLVVEWIQLHKDELLLMWETQDLHPIEPLR